MKTIFALLLLLSASWGITNVTLPYIVDTASIPKVKYVDKNDSALKWGVNNLGDTLNAATGTGVLVRKTGAALTTPSITGPTFVGTIATPLTASRTVITDGSGNLSTNTETGTGNHVRATSPTLVTPVLGAATGTSLNLSGNLTADSLVSPKFYNDTGSFTATLTGVSPSVTGTARYVRVGKSVILYLPRLMGTSNATTCTITGLPASIIPARNASFSGPLIWSNGTLATGTALAIQSDGVIMLYAGGTTSGFANVSLKGLNSMNASDGVCFPYILQ